MNNILKIVQEILVLILVENSSVIFLTFSHFSVFVFVLTLVEIFKFVFFGAFRIFPVF